MPSLALLGIAKHFGAGTTRAKIQRDIATLHWNNENPLRRILALEPLVIASTWHGKRRVSALKLAMRLLHHDMCSGFRRFVSGFANSASSSATRPASAALRAAASSAESKTTGSASTV